MNLACCNSFFGDFCRALGYFFSYAPPQLAETPSPTDFDLAPGLSHFLIAMAEEVKIILK